MARVGAWAVSRVSQHIEAERPFVARAGCNVPNDTARLEFQRLQAAVGGEHLRRHRLEIGDRAAALPGQRPQRFHRGHRLIELQLQARAPGQRLSPGTSAGVVGVPFGPPPDNWQAQHQAQQEYR